MKKIAVYGSLRRGMYNHARYMSTAKLLGVQTLYGWDMYSTGDYPCISKGDGKVIVEIYEVDDITFDRIRSMELGANYTGEEVKTNFGMVMIYTMSRDETHMLYPVTYGDWRQYATGQLGGHGFIKRNNECEECDDCEEYDD